MNGGITWDEAWGLPFKSREKVIKVVNKKLKQQSGDTTEYM